MGKKSRRNVPKTTRASSSSTNSTTESRSSAKESKLDNAPHEAVEATPTESVVSSAKALDSVSEQESYAEAPASNGDVIAREEESIQPPEAPAGTLPASDTTPVAVAGQEFGTYYATKPRAFIDSFRQFFVGMMQEEKMILTRLVLAAFPFLFVFRIFGAPITWIQTPHFLSELRSLLASPFRLFQLLSIYLFSLNPFWGFFVHFLSPAAVPSSTTVTAPGIRTEDLERSKNEYWIYVNGIASDITLQRKVGLQLSKMFGRRIELVHKPSHGILLDLWETICGLVVSRGTLQPHDYLFKRLSIVLSSEQIKHVRLICHSQGGIVAQLAIERLIREIGDQSLLEKLEVYSFGNSSNKLDAQVRIASSSEGGGSNNNNPREARFVPYYEHFVNTQDIVAEIGILGSAADSKARSNVFTAPIQGHLFGLHYLSTFAQLGYKNENTGRRDAKLYSILKGAPAATY